MQTSTLTTLFTHMFLPAMAPEHPLAPIGRILHDLAGRQRSHALLDLLREQETTPLQRAAALLLLGDEKEAQTLLTALVPRELGSGARIAQILLALLLCEQGQPEWSLPHWRHGCGEDHSQHFTVATIRRVGFDPGMALLCRCLAHTLCEPSQGAYAACLGALWWKEGDPSLLLLRAINAHAMNDLSDARHALRLAGEQMQTLPTHLLKASQGIPPTLLIPTLLAWMGRRQGTRLLGRYDEVIEWLEETESLGKEKALLQAPLQEERALLRVLLAQQIHAQHRIMQEHFPQA